MRKNYSTFDQFVEYPQDLPPIKITKELIQAEGYESSYVTRYNILVSCGWEYSKTKKWINPRDSSLTYPDIDSAFASQKLYEIVNG